MDAEWAVFVFALLGAYVQGVTGFAMSMIMLTGVTAVAPVPLSVTTAVVSLASLANIVLSLRGHLRSIAARGFLILLLGQVPFLALGLALLTYLDAQLRAFSELLLGVFIVAGCGAMMLRPVPRETRSTSWGFALAEAGGGLRQASCGGRACLGVVSLSPALAPRDHPRDPTGVLCGLDRGANRPCGVRRG